MLWEKGVFVYIDSIVCAHIEPLVASNSPSILLFLHSLLELFDLFFEKFSQELAELVEGDFAWFIIVEYRKNNFVSLLKISAAIALARMNSFQKTFHKSFHLFFFERARVVSVDGIEDRFVDFWEFLLVNKDIG